MAYRIPDSWMDRFYSQLDIVQIVSSYVPLKRNGKRYVGLCPFHHEKTPSFSVTPDKNLYYCFGCKAGGNAVQFVMAMEHLEYLDAVRFLADRMHMPMPEMENDPNYEQRKNKREKLFEINREAARYYHRLLWTDAGKPVLDYFRKRGLDDDVIRKFGLGASGPDRSGLTDELSAKGYDPADLIEAGVSLRGESTPYDMFRARAMFPIIDLHGQVLGFGGRRLDSGQPKYLNTADTPVFNKRFGVFGANLLRKARDLKRVILVEGYMDVVALTQFGIDGVAATLGTSLTEEQARLLKRFAPEVWISYDGDEAGQRAIMRAIGIFEHEGVPVKVLFFPDGLDPDEFIRQRGADAFHAIEPMTSVAYMMERSAVGKDLSKDRDRIEYAKVCCGIIRKIRDPVDRDYYLGILSLKTGFRKDVLLAQMTEGSQTEPPERPTAFQRKQMDKEAPSAVRTTEAERLLFALVASGKLPKGTVTEEDFVSPVLAGAARMILGGKSPDEVIRESEDPVSRSAITEALQTEIEDDPETDPLIAAQDCLRLIHLSASKARLEEIKKQMASMPMDSPERAGAMKRIMELQKEIQLLNKKQPTAKDKHI